MKRRKKWASTRIELVTRRDESSCFAAMKTKAFLTVGLVAAIWLAVARWGTPWRSASGETVRATTAQPATLALPVAAPLKPTDPAPLDPTGGTSKSAMSPQPNKAAPANKGAPALLPNKSSKEPLHDPAARVAMTTVGIDPEAESYWLGAVFDSNLPKSEREDLMEDLNEAGLSDPKHPGPQDLPVILNRLALIEEMLPFADDFMVEHLGEAYKDLCNLADITQGGGEPVH